MRFLYPNFLFALFTVLIPVIIHFFNFRKYKTIYFSDTRFIKNLEQETNSKNRIRHLLILLNRILILAFLVLAFARPYIPVNENLISNQNHLVGIYIDNSFSMEAEGKSGKIIELAKNKAIEIAKAYPPATKFLLTTNEYDIKLDHPLNFEQLIDQISQIEITSFSRPVVDIYKRQIDILNTIKNNNNFQNINEDIFWISDGQKSTFNINKIDVLDSANVKILILPSQDLGNIFIDTCWFESPARVFKHTDKLIVRIVNNSNNNYSNLPVKLYLNDSLKSISSITLKPQSHELVEMNYTNSAKGIINGRVEINDYPITYDNELFFSYIIEDKANMLIINGNEENRYLNALFENDDNFKLSQVKIARLDYSDFNAYQTLILNEIDKFSTGLIQQIKSYLSTGGTIIIFPSWNIDKISYNEFLSDLGLGKFEGIDSSILRVNKIYFEDRIFTDVFFEQANNIEYPVISKYYIFDHLNESFSHTIISLSNQKPVLVTAPFQNGRIYCFTIPLSTEFSDFPQNPILVPTLYNMALYNQRNKKLYYLIGENESITINEELNSGRFENLRIVNTATEYDILVKIDAKVSGSYIQLPGNIEHAGFYTIIQNNENLKGLSINYSRSESNLDKYDMQEITDQIILNELNNFTLFEASVNEITQYINELNQGKQLWKMFILISILLLGTEIFLLRVFS